MSRDVKQQIQAEILSLYVSVYVHALLNIR
jgi:hypothetical protein